MTKAELIDRLHKGAAKGLSKKAVTEVVDELFDCIAKSVKKDKRFAYPGFGTWSLRTRAARVGRNPKTGQEIQIAKTKTVAFKPSAHLKGVVK